MVYFIETMLKNEIKNEIKNMNKGNLEVADFLFQAGCEADLIAAANDGCTALHLARGNSCGWVLKKLREYDNKFEHQQQQNAFLQKLLVSGDNHGDTPLLIACLYGDLIASRHLIKILGLTVQQKEQERLIVSRNATKKQKLDEGRRKNAQSKVEDDSKLSMVLNYDGEESGRNKNEPSTLLKTQSRTINHSLEDHINHHGSTILHNCCVGGHDELLRWLLREVDNISHYVSRVDCCGDTPLRIASHWASADCCYTLIQYGALTTPAADESNVRSSSGSSGGSGSSVRDVESNFGGATVSSSPDTTNTKMKKNDDDNELNLKQVRKYRAQLPDPLVFARDVPRMIVDGMNKDLSLEDQQRRRQSLEHQPQQNMPSSSSFSNKQISQQQQQQMPPLSDDGDGVFVYQDVRKLMKEYSLSDIEKYEQFRDSFLIGCLKKKSPNLARLRKASKDLRDRPKRLIADYAGIIHGSRLYNVKQLLVLLQDDCV
jgi:ankyrin repeat protein